MSRNLFVQDPVSRALGQEAPTIRSRGTMRPEQTKTADTDYLTSLSRRTQLPPNLLEALTERHNGNPQAVEAEAMEIAKEGGDLRDTLSRRYGTDAQSLFDRANAIADSRASPRAAQPAPDQVTEAPAEEGIGTLIADGAKALGGGVMTGVGMAGRFIGEVLGGGDRPEELKQGPIGRLTELLNMPMRGIGNLIGAASEPWEEVGGDMVGSVSQGTQRAMEGSQPKGSLLNPSTWDFGEDPSLRGYSALALNVLGNLIPIIAAGVVGGGGAAAVVGGAQSGAGGRDNAEEALRAAAESGELQATSGMYQTLIEQGVSPEEALDRTIKAGADVAGLMSMSVGAVGGALTSRIFSGIGRGGNAASRVASGAAIGAVEEGAQEALEGAAALTGGGLGAGVDLDPMQNTFGDFLMGALAGAPIGAFGGLRGEKPEDDEMGDDPAQRIAPPNGPAGLLPPPTAGESAADAARRAQTPIVAEGPVAGDPTSNLPAYPGNPSPVGTDPSAALRPQGPLSRIAQAAAGGIPAPAPEPVAPAPLYPEMKAGQALALYDPDGRPVKVHFLREENGSVIVRDKGRELAIPAADFDAAMRKPDANAPRPDAKIEQAAASAITAPTPPVTDNAAEIASLDAKIRKIQDMGRKEGLTPRAADQLTKLQERRAALSASPAPSPDIGIPISAAAPEPVNPVSAPTGPISAAAAPVAPPAPRAPEAPRLPETLEDTEKQIQNIRAQARRGSGYTGAMSRRLKVLEDHKATFAGAQAAMDLGGPDTAPAPSNLAPEAQPAPAPTQAQAEAGNYKKGHTRAHGLDISIENAAGQTRSGTDKGGKPWSVTMPADYGYIRRTEGADGDHVDVYLGPQPEADTVYVVDQNNADTGAFDEHKVMMGFADEASARATYLQGFSDGKGEARLGAMTAMPVADFKAWLADGDTTAPLAQKPAAPVEVAQEPAKSLTPQAEQVGETSIEEVKNRPKALALKGVPKDQTPEVGKVSFQWNDAAGGWIFSAKHREAVAAAYGAKAKTEAPKPAYDPNAPVKLVIKSLQTGKEREIDIPGKEAEAPAPKPKTPQAPPMAGMAPMGKAEAPADKAMEERGAADRRRGRPLPMPEDITSQADRDAYVKGYGEEHRKMVDEQKARDKAANPATNSPNAKPPSRNPVAARPKIGDPAYSRDDALADLHALEEQQAKNGTVEDARLQERIEKMRDLLATFDKPAVPEADKPLMPSPEEAEAAAQPDPSKAPAAGLLSNLSQEKQARAAELKARLAAKARNQINSGIDPEYITLGGELVALYIESGVKAFGQMLRDFAETTGLSIREAQAPMRAAYNHVRDDMDLNGEDVSAMDDHAAVMAEVRKAIAEEAEGAKAEPEPTEGNADERQGSEGTGPLGTGGEPQTRGTGGTPAGDTAGNVASGPVEDGTAGSGEGDGAPAGADGAGARNGGQDRKDADRTPRKRNAAKRRKDGSDAGVGADGPRNDAPAPVGRANYRITDPEALFAGGPKSRFARNRKAMETYQTIIDENREPTPEELDALAAFTGWGSFGQELFQGSWGYDRAKDDWKDESKWLREHLGKEGWESAQKSIINAHYTDPPTVQALWSAIERMGFKGGRVLEPAMGIGNFFGLMPPHLSANSNLTGIELEQTTGTMAKMLYPQANVKIMGYEKSVVPDGFYDLVIGNWPFANIKIPDRRYSALDPSLHDYFFLKAVDQVRAGGLVVGITSAMTMDGQKNRGLRRALASKAELVAAFRMPSGAFGKYAGTNVVTDVLILKKRDKPIADAGSADWVPSVPKNLMGLDEPQFHLNNYYELHPENILGELDFGHGTTYGKAGMIVNRPDNYAELLADLPNRLPKNIYEPIKRGKEPRFTAVEGKPRRFEVIEGKDGQLYQALGDHMAPLLDVAKIAVAKATDTAARVAQIKALVGIGKSLNAVMAADREGAANADALRADLKKAYDAFKLTHGAIKGSFGLTTLEKLRDPNAPFIQALETPQGEPAAIMSRSTVRAPRRMDKPSVRDAFVLARNESATFDIQDVADLAKKPVDAVAAELLEAKAIYRAPGGVYLPADQYLSGNVRQKLKEAKAALEQGEDMQASVDALTEVLPKDVEYFNIEARFGADWIPVDVNTAFIHEELGIKPDQAHHLQLHRGVTGWTVVVSEQLAHRAGISDFTGAPLSGTRGTGLSLKRFLEATLNSQSVTVTAGDSESTWRDQKSTDQANQKISDLKGKFAQWLWNDPERRVEMETSYNDMMNAIATPKVDGSFLDFPGMMLEKGDKPFNLRQHQVNAIWRGILNRRGIYGHEVGTGKTLTMAGIAVESKRYGLARKPLIIAHNANSAAVSDEIQQAYPGARVLYVPTLTPDEIQGQLARIATEDWDAIVIPHSLIDRMALTEETLMEMAADELAALEREAIAASEEGDGKTLTLEMLDDPEELKKARLPITAKELVKARERLLNKIKEQAMRASQEGAVSFEELGIDMILIDEVHEFKKPPMATRMQMRGLNKGTSGRSLALRFLTNYVKRIRGDGTGIHTFSGTLITNTLPEIYHQMVYVMDDVMKQNKVDTWDGFFKTFADAVADVELTSTGEFENVERLASFVNVSELRNMAGQFLDIVFASDMPEFKPRQTASGKTLSSKDLTPEERDFLENGRTEDAIGRPYKRVIHDIGPMSNDQRRILMQQIQYATDFRNSDGKTRREIMQRGGPDMPLVYNAVPNRASMDPRLHELNAEDSPHSKVNRAAARVAQIYHDEPMATQVIFFDEGFKDFSTSKKKNADGSTTKTIKEKLNLAEDLRKKLIAAGVKEEEIAIVAGGLKAEKKREIAAKMNSRQIRVVMGQTATLGVGVNMQENLRAMHHLDAPWMPGDLEQRNGRGERQGNKWNTVLEYRYLTEGLDGRRWQVLAIKDRFIKAFLQARDGVRVIDGDALDDADSMDVGGLQETLAQAAGDPRLQITAKLQKQIDKLQKRERVFTQGVADSARRAKNERASVERIRENLGAIRDDAEFVTKLREAGTFTATIDGKTYTERGAADEALKAFIADQQLRMRRGESRTISAEVQGFGVKIYMAQYGTDSPYSYQIVRQDSYTFGQASLASLETAVRRVATNYDATLARIEDQLALAERLERAAGEPFQQAGDLAKKKAQLEAVLADLEANPVPPPSWLRQGAPIDTLIYVLGEERVVTGHRYTSDGWFVMTEEGPVPYMKATNLDGVPLYEEVEFVPPAISEGAKAKGLDDEADEDGNESRQRRDPLSLEGPALTTGNIRAIAADLNAEIARTGLAGKVSARVVAGLTNAAGIPIQGRQSRAYIAVNPAAEDGALGVLRHELVHALRDSTLWGQPYGLFTQEEWRALTAAARSDKAIAADIAERYPDLSRTAQAEEVIAEQYRHWAARRDAQGPLGRAFTKIRDFLTALANAFTGKGFTSQGRIFESIANGGIGGRGPNGPNGRGPASVRESRAPAPRAPDGRFKAATNWVRDLPVNSKAIREFDPKAFFSNLMTDAMGGAGGSANILSLVPLRPLLDEVGRNLPSAKVFMRAKEEMDAIRNDWHARTDKVAQDWIKLNRAGKAENAKLMDMMHRSTLAGIDPSKDFDKAPFDEARRILQTYGPRGDMGRYAQETLAREAQAKADYDKLRAEFDTLPAEYRAMFSKVAKEYDAMGDAFEEAVIENMRKSAKAAVKRAERAYHKEMRRIEDEGLDGKERKAATDEAKATLARAKSRAGWATESRINGMRAEFESNRLKGPYFPLARFGNYFVTGRDANGKVVSFSKAESKGQQARIIRELEAKGLTVQHGVMSDGKSLQDQVDPQFVQDIINIVGGMEGVDHKVLDAIWQRWLETMPDQSIRTSRIHRKGREGYHNDALRAFSNHMFHGAHQLARLKYGVDLHEALKEAETEASTSRDPERDGMVVNEISRRLDFINQPTNAPWTQKASTLAFIWYLGVSPAAALANITQTTVMGPAILGARFTKGGVTGAITELGKAAKDMAMASVTDLDSEKHGFMQSKNLTAAEKRAMEEAIRRGVIEKTQAHDIASVGETGIEYNGRREQVMRVVGAFFHKGEVFNRTATFLAGYRMAVAEGLSHEDAIQASSDTTYRAHFDYQNTSRPRFMQGDWPKVFLIFRQYQVNTLYRLARDLHQSFHGASPELRKEARTQFIGITLSMMAHAGIKGTWGYGLITMLLGMFFAGGDDDVDRWLQDALLVEGEGMGAAAWNFSMGMVLNGIPGHVTGTSLSERIGMPNLWFRAQDRDPESASDWYKDRAFEALGPAASIPEGWVRGAGLVLQGETWRGLEAMAPKFLRDGLKAGRYFWEGVQTRNGDPLIEDASVADVMKQALGFTPAAVSERYAVNSRLMNRQNRIMDERSGIMRRIGDAIMANRTIAPADLEAMRAFNRAYPSYPISSDNIRQSVSSRMRQHQRNEFGIALNPRLNAMLRGEEAPTLY